MKIIQCCLFLILLSCSNVSKEKTETLPFELTPQGHILMKAKVNGVEGNFIFDTGAGLNLFLTSFAEKIDKTNLKRSFIAHRATGEPIKAPLFESDEVYVGNLLFEKIKHSVVDLEVPGLDGILSLQMFTNTDITIDYSKKEIRFGDIHSKETAPSIDIQIADYAGNALDIFTLVKIDDSTEAQVMLDSGAGSGVYWLNRDLMDTLKFNYEEFLITEKQSDFSAEHKNVFYRGKIQSISNSFDTLIRPDINFVDGLIYEGKMSIDWLGAVVGISLRDKKIYQLKK